MRPLGDVLCPGCGRWYWKNCAWQHEKCAINNPVAINTTAINKANGETPLDQPVIPVAMAEHIAGVDSPERRTPNRRNRVDYNAYMREYMRKFRERKRDEESKIEVTQAG